MFQDRGPIGSGDSIDSLGLRGNIGLTYRFECPALGSARQYEVWGTPLYTSDSPICWAALHSQVLQRAQPGEVFVVVRAGQPGYVGSYRNTAVSLDYTAYAGSFEVLGAPTAPPVPFDGGSLWRGDPPTPLGPIDWEEDPQANRWSWGSRFSYQCPPVSSTMTLATIWGSGPYTDNSRVCVAAAHSGVITRDGGTVVIEIVPGIAVYPSSTRFGIISNTYGRYDGSFLVVP